MNVEAEVLWRNASKISEGGIIVEIGSWLGSSTYAMALACIDRGIKIYAIDTFMGSPGGVTEWKQQHTGYFEQFKINLKEFIDKGVVIPLEMSSAGALMYEPRLEPDLLFIDGSHQYEDVLFDLTYWWERLKPNGLLALHDSTGDPRWHPQVKDALLKFMKDRNMEPDHMLIVSTSWLRKEKQNICGRV